MTNQSPILNSQFDRVGINIKEIFKIIVTARNFMMFYTYSSRTHLN